MKSSLIHLTIWLVIAVTVLAGYGFWYAAVAEKSIAVADLQNQIDTKVETANRISAARTALADIASDESIVQNYFVPEDGVVSFINNLETRARAQTATMKVLSVATGGTKKQPTLMLSLTIDGTFDAVMRTIGAIEYAPYDLSVSKFLLGKTEKNIWHASIELVVGSIPSNIATSTLQTP